MVIFHTYVSFPEGRARVVSPNQIPVIPGQLQLEPASADVLQVPFPLRGCCQTSLAEETGASQGLHLLKRFFFPSPS